MEKPFLVKIIRLVEGEDLPLMLNGATHMPLYLPTAYIVGTRRLKYASQTLEVYLRHLMVLYAWGLVRGIDIDERFLYGDFLNIDEYEELLEYAGYFYVDIVKKVSEPKSNSKRKKKVVELEKYFSRQKVSKARKVKNGRWLQRVITIRKYLDWLAVKRLHSINSGNMSKYRLLSDRRTEIKESLTENAPKPKTESVFLLPKGIDFDEERLLFDVIDPQSPVNPWRNQNIRIRNHLFITLLFDLGVRRSEALAIKIHDIDFKESTIWIAKRPNDPDDERPKRPRQKTLSRKLYLSSGVRILLKKYVQQYRLIIRRGRVKGFNHEFLFVSTTNGAALSLSSADTMMAVLRNIPGIPEELTTHTGRRNWNDRFSAWCDQNNIDHETEKKMRNAFMGWSRNSKMALIYARRHIIEKSNEYQKNIAEKWCAENISRNRNFLDTLNQIRQKVEINNEDIPF